ncbi:MAG: DNA-processing protein DprA [Blautia sp.]|nr:DNA-processing protein DprA [Blautia sp.]
MDRKDDISFITPFDREYPEKLRNIPDAPSGLYVRGRLPVETDITVAVIGARECSDYGRYVAEGLGAFFGKNGVTVVSGMAKGIDGISQWAALEAGGTSVGVLGCGVDICYPARNRELFDRLLEQGTVFSEYPPGTPPRSMNFPARNRIVSGLADAVVVVEARSRSGTLITVDMALEQGREVFVVPGRITDRLSDGCNRLIKQGAGMLLSPEELLEELWELKERTGCKAERRERAPNEKKKHGMAQKKRNDELQKGQSAEVAPKLRDIYQALDFYPRSVEQIMTHLSPDVTQRQATIWLIQLCMDNKAVQVSPGYFKAIRQ